MPNNQLRRYYLATIVSIVFALAGFSYNLWRLEVSEANNTVRTAAFEVLKELAALEQLVYAAHYDKNTEQGNPRIGWVKVGLIVDLSQLIDEPVNQQALLLKTVWQSHWAHIIQNRDSADTVVRAIEAVRHTLSQTLKALN
jgi:hypothetical protein